MTTQTPTGHRVLSSALQLLATLPLPIVHALGATLGRVCFAWPGRYRERVQQNAAQAGYSSAVFSQAAAAQTGAMMAELAPVWFRSEASVDRVVCDDWKIVEEALAENRGLIFLQPHLGCFEVAARYAAERIPLTIMYRPHRKALLRSVLSDVRKTASFSAVPANGEGVRAFVRALRRGEAIGLLPDQAPKTDGVWVPFFGRLAYTMTLPGKLAAQTGAPVILAAGERLPSGLGWRVHVKRLEGPVPTADKAQALWINAALEEMVRRFPEQYLWGYNRYKEPRGAEAPRE